jgi:ribosomal protein S27E
MKKLKVTNKNSGYKKLQCKYCVRIAERVDANALAVTCWKCTSDLVNGKILDLRK